MSDWRLDRQRTAHGGRRLTLEGQPTTTEGWKRLLREATASMLDASPTGCVELTLDAPPGDGVVADPRALLATAASLDRARQGLRVPVLVRARGFLLGPVFTLALSADLLVVEPGMAGALLAWQDRPLPLPGDLPALAHRLGRTRALEIALTGRSVEAAELVAWGGAVTGEDADVAWRAAARGSRVAQAAALDLLRRRGGQRALGEALERASFALCFASADREEGVRAFFERRTPRFGGHGTDSRTDEEARPEDEE